MGQDYWSRLSAFTTAEQQSRPNMNNKNIKDNDLLKLFRQKSEGITSLSLSKNQITSIGLMYFSTLPWDRLEPNHKIGNNLITSIGCKYLTRTSMKRIVKLTLTGNLITVTGLSHLAKSQWSNLNELSLYAAINLIDSVYWTTKGEWPKVEQIFLASNLIKEDEGKWFVMVETPRLRSFSLANNTIKNTNKLRTLAKEKKEKLNLNI